MVEAIASLFERLIEKGEINDHAGLRIWMTANDDLRPVRMAMDPATWLDVHGSLKRVRRVEAKFSAEFVHLSDTHEFVCLQRKSPARVLQAIRDRSRSIVLAVGVVAWLQKEVFEGEALE